MTVWFIREIRKPICFIHISYDMCWCPTVLDLQMWKVSIPEFFKTLIITVTLNGKTLLKLEVG